MGNHYKCMECGSMNVEMKPCKKIEASATLYKDKAGKYEEDIGFGTQEEDTNKMSFFCKDCKNLDDGKFILMSDTD